MAPVVHRHDHERRPASGHRLVVGTRDRRGHALRPEGQVGPHGVVAGEALQPARQERLRGDVTAVLLAHDDDERHPVHPCGGERADGVAEPRRGVQDRERRLAPPDREAGCHPDDGALVEPEDEPQIGREVGEQLDLGRARVGEERGEAVLPEDVERRVAHGREHDGQPTRTDLILLRWAIRQALVPGAPSRRTSRPPPSRASRAAVTSVFASCSSASRRISTRSRAEVGLTQDEWEAGIRLLTETGHITDEHRQEFVLWSDTLGLSMLVDALASPSPDATESTVLGPFYVPGAPRRQYGEAIAEEAAGVPAWVHGVVTDTAGAPIAGAELDVWQNGDNRLYAVQDPERARGAPPRPVLAPARTGATRSWRSGRCPTRSRTTGRSARCSPRRAGTRGARRTST